MPLTASPPLIIVIITSIKFNIPPTIVKAIASFNWSMESIAVNSFSLDKLKLTPLPLPAIKLYM